MTTSDEQELTPLIEREPVRMLASQRSDLQTELDSIDFEALTRAAKQAEAEYHSLRQMSPSNVIARFLHAERHQQAVQTSYGLHKAARDRLQEGTNRASVLTREIAALDHMLTAEARGQHARDEFREALAAVASAEQALHESERAFERIVSMVDEAEGAYSEAKSNAAAAVLAAVKAGSGGAKIPTPSRDRIETLVAARASAEAEIAAAREVLRAARARCEEAKQAVADANHGLRKLAEHVAQHAYAETLQRIVAAHVVEIDLSAH